MRAFQHFPSPARDKFKAIDESIDGDFVPCLQFRGQLSLFILFIWLSFLDQLDHCKIYSINWSAFVLFFDDDDGFLDPLIGGEINSQVLKGIGQNERWGLKLYVGEMVRLSSLSRSLSSPLSLFIRPPPPSSCFHSWDDVFFFFLLRSS